MDKNIYFISESTPHRGYGSFVVFYRHLTRLEQDGYKIHLIIPDYDDVNAEYLGNNTWNIIKVPFKKWWFLLPYRYDSRTSRNIRFKFIINWYLRKHLNRYRPGFIITYFHGVFFNGLAARIKEQYNCRLGIFLHDDKHLLYDTDSAALLKYDRELSESADVIWSVSKELMIPGTDSKKYELLFPVPADDMEECLINWRDEYQKPVIGFSGNVYDAYAGIFDKLAIALKKWDGQLLLIINNPSNYNWVPALISTHTNIRVVNSFANAKQAADFLKANCTALFCGYPDAMVQMPWIKSCFPSKFVEFSHFCLPVILTSPPGTALNNWAIKHHWTLFSPSYTDEAFDRIFTAIATEKGWADCAEQSKIMARKLFNANVIHGQFMTTIKNLTAS